jgi:S1-C subfamily serine protease
MRFIPTRSESCAGRANHSDPPELADEIDLPVDYGLLIVRVTPDQSGLRAGTERACLGDTAIMLGGDLLVDIDDRKVQDEEDLSQMMNDHRAGDTVKITSYRNKEKMDVSVSLGEARGERDTRGVARAPLLPRTISTRKKGFSNAIRG